MKILNFGCGDKVIPGIVNLDKIAWAGDPRVVIQDITTGRLPFEDDHFDAIIAHHSLQMIKYTDFIPALKELMRVLRPGGVIRVSVPDAMKAFRMYEADEADYFPIVDEAEKSIEGKLCAYLTWYSEAKMVFSEDWLWELFTRAGYSEVSRSYYHHSATEELNQYDLRPDESIFIEALK